MLWQSLLVFSYIYLYTEVSYWNISFILIDNFISCYKVSSIMLSLLVFKGTWTLHHFEDIVRYFWIFKFDNSYHIRRISIFTVHEANLVIYDGLLCYIVNCYPIIYFSWLSFLYKLCNLKPWISSSGAYSYNLFQKLKDEQLETKED